MDKPFRSQKFHNITISGLVAAGATTLAEKLSKKLGWELFKGGKLTREYAQEEAIPLEKTTVTSDKFHLELDNLIKQKLTINKYQIIESWLSGFDARGIPKVYKIFVVCPSEEKRIKRLMKRDKMTAEEAKKHLRTREEENLKKWSKLYKTKDFWNAKYYNLTINTCNLGKDEILKTALRGIGYYN